MVPESSGPRVRWLDSRSALEGVVITGGGLSSASGSGSGGGDVRADLLPRNPARGKGVLVKEERPIEVPIEQVEFRPAAGSSGHKPITRGNFAESIDEVVLDQLLRDNPAVVAAVVAAREDRQRVIELAQEEEWLWAEAKRSRVDGEVLVREAERAQVDEAWARESAVA